MADGFLSYYHEVRASQNAQDMIAATPSRGQEFINSLRYRYRGRETEPTTVGSVRSRSRRKATWTAKTSTYLSITGSKPYTIGGQVKESQDGLRAELKGSYGEPNPRLLDEFFPYPELASNKTDLDLDVNPSRNGDIPSSVKKFYGDMNRPSAKGANGERTENLTQGWTGIPEPPVHTEQPSIKEKDITEALVPIINAIISHQGLSDRRVAIDRQQNPIRTLGGNSLKPDIFLWGKGSPAFPGASGIPPPTTPSAKNRKIQRAENSKKLDQAPPVEWQWCVIPIEVKTERTRYVDDNQGMFQLATYVREVFVAQPHRRFVPSLLFTESTVEFFLWDRAGVIFSEGLDYHAKAARFCHIIATIVSWNDEELGLDTSVRFANDALHISTRSDAYVVDPVVPVAQSYNIRSHGMTCWRARKSDDLDAHIYLILDTWSGNWVCDDMIRITVEEIRLKNPLLSPAEWVSFDAVHTSYTVTGLPPSRQYVDSINTNRRLVGVADNLDHGRSVWRCSGNECVPLEKFHTLLELVCALRDVVQELKILFLDLKMMHRDIVPWNIYIHRETEGSRGFLVDFSHAAVMDGRDIPPRLDITPVGTLSDIEPHILISLIQGSSIFMSRGALDKKPTTHCEDLESLYYLLCSIIAGHTCHNIGTSRLPHADLPRALKRWMLDDPLDASDGKKYHFTDAYFNIRVQEAFMPLKPLASKLYSFFYNRRTYNIATASHYSFTPEQDFNEFLGCFEEAIDKLKVRNSGTKRTRDIHDAEDGSDDIDRVAKRVKTEL